VWGAHERADRWGVRNDAPNPHVSDEARIQKALDWLDHHAATIGKPWTLEVNIGAPHFPHYVTQEEWDLYPTGGDLPRYGGAEESALHPIALDLRRHFETDLFTEAQVRGLRRGYLGCVTFVDRQLGRLLDAYERLGLARSTVIVYTSDHGEMLGKFGMWWKCSLYEDSARVPLLVAGPGFSRGARVKTAVNQFDLQASLFRATGSRRPSGWHGTPLQEIPRDDAGRSTFCEYHGHGTRCSSYMIRKGRWKLIYHADAPHQLFDLEADPSELRSRADAHPDVMSDLTADLRRICNPEAENRRAEETISAQLKAIARNG
jgi:choline-sulfatase